MNLPSPILTAQLLGDIILVRADSRELMPNGLYAPTQYQHPDHARRFDMVRTGTVMQTGPGKKSKKTGVRLPMQLNEGDRIAFLDWIGAPLPDQARPAWEDDLLFMHESEALAVLAA